MALCQSRPPLALSLELGIGNPALMGKDRHTLEQRYEAPEGKGSLADKPLACSDWSKVALWLLGAPPGFICTKK